jgi:hypothetical protein
VEPQYIYDMESPKDEVMANIAKYYPIEKKRLYQKKMYGDYLLQRADLL